jgi:Tfp pilus assembly protein PilX
MKNLSTYKKNKDNNRNANSGFTLFIALIVSSLLLAIGFSLSTIILKQLVFANSGKESQLAFYAADSGAECALYWDRKNVDGLTDFNGTFTASSTISTFDDIFCGTGGPTTPQTARVGSFLKTYDASGEQATTTFYVDYSDSSDLNHKACAKVTVFKWIDTTSGTPVEKTQIESRGYNVPLDSGAIGVGGNAICDFAASNRVVERAVRLDY